jgi:uncharacterized SAM-binding protein YcdF (DUF218 family)
MVALLLGLPVVLVAALAWRVDHVARRPAATVNARAIVMLGARVLPSGRAAPALEYRAEKAAELYLAGRAPLLVLTGGHVGKQPSEARIACDIAVRRGVPQSACLLEENSHSTYENVQNTAPLLAERGISEVILVSDGYHLLRAQAHFAAAGITTHPVRSDRVLSPGDRLFQTLREVAALLRRPWLIVASAPAPAAEG